MNSTFLLSVGHWERTIIGLSRKVEGMLNRGAEID